ncbi:MAG: Mur ligase domain-containing protein [Candidatus Omnitrophota bacterium]
MRLKEIIKGIGVTKIKGPEDIIIKGVTCDSRQVKNGFLFVAIIGNKLNGTKFISQALKNQATCIVAESFEKQPAGVTLITVNDVRAAYAGLCSNFFNNPTDNLKVIGITGTRKDYNRLLNPGNIGKGQTPMRKNHNHRL